MIVYIVMLHTYDGYQLKGVHRSSIEAAKVKRQLEASINYKDRTPAIVTVFKEKVK